MIPELDRRTQEYVENEAWLDLGDTRDWVVPSPWALVPEDLRDDPAASTLWIARRPEYFLFTCKAILNIELPPYQMAILQQLWTYPFPMLVGCRGLGKSFLLGLYCILRALLDQGSKIVIVGAAFRQSKMVFDYAANIWHNAPVLRDLVGDSRQNGPRYDVDRCQFRLGESIISAIPVGDGCVRQDTLVTWGGGFGQIADHVSGKICPTPGLAVWGANGFKETDESYRNGHKPTKVVRTALGLEVEMTHNHRLRVLRDGEVCWVRADEMVVGDRLPVDRSWRWHSAPEKVGEDEAYALGAMIGDGCYTSPYKLGFATIEPEHFIPVLNRALGTDFSACSDGQHWSLHGKERVAEWMRGWGLDHVRGHQKKLPHRILRASREAMSACLRGLFDTDGTLQVSKEKGGTGVTVTLPNTSKELIRQVQYILLHYGVVSSVTSRDRNERWNRIYELHITGKDAIAFAEHVGFALPYKRDALLAGITEKKRQVSYGDTIPGLLPLMLEVARRTPRKAKARGRDATATSPSKLANYKEATHDLVGKFLRAYGHLEDPLIERIRSLARPELYYDEVVSIEDSACETYDIHVPDGHEYCANGFLSHNSKIRGYRASHLITDEFASINPEIFENVIQGFSMVSGSPVVRVKARARRRALRELGYTIPDEVVEQVNQSIISGSAYYSFNHFYAYWKRYKSIIETGGDPKRLEEILGGPPEKGFDWRDFCVIRVPYDVLPDGYMDEKTIAKSKATIHSVQFNMEAGACFAEDSDGFFKRSLIELCVVGRPAQPIIIPDVGEVLFHASLAGDPGRQYVYAVDPASQADNFAITILEVWPNHRRVVYCWTATKAVWEEARKGGLTQTQTFYSFCARKIRDLMRVFNMAHLSMDSQGGGHQISEALNDENVMLPGEQKIWPIIDPAKPADSDGEPGLHVLELVSFAKGEWVSYANHGLKKDLEARELLFPAFSPLALGIALEDDKASGRVKVDENTGKTIRLTETLEDVVMEIEELKDELATIQHSATATGREHWDTPEIKQPGSRKGRYRKDRYSALLMANAAARTLARTPAQPTLTRLGGFAHTMVKKKDEGPLYTGPAWFTSQLGSGAGLGMVRRRRP